MQRALQRDGLAVAIIATLNNSLIPPKLATTHRPPCEFHLVRRSVAARINRITFPEIGFAGDYAVQLWFVPDCSSSLAALIDAGNITSGASLVSVPDGGR